VAPNGANVLADDCQGRDLAIFDFFSPYSLKYVEKLFENSQARANLLTISRIMAA
jgi:hypothetical protein